VRVLHQASSPFAGGYRSDSVAPWPPGESREVAPEVAAYLTDTFGSAFVVEASESEASIDILDPTADAPTRKRK
jgi:hypothetical protein